MSSSANNVLLGLLTLAVVMASAQGQPAGGHYGYGDAATKKQIAAWNIDARPDGKGLPPGSGPVDAGAELFQGKCAACHGTFGTGNGRYASLSGGLGTLTDARPEKTVGSYWPYATTLYDYIHRAMPFYAPQSLSNEQVYAITAYVLNLNNIVESDFVANAKSLPKVNMPNRNGFYRPDPRPDVDNPRCMQGCRDPDEVEITSSSAGKDITPRTTGPMQKKMTQ